MSTTEIQIELTETARVERWRTEELEHAGFDPDSAARLAARHDIDLHRAVDLIARGCSPELAVRILI